MTVTLEQCERCGHSASYHTALRHKQTCPCPKPIATCRGCGGIRSAYGYGLCRTCYEGKNKPSLRRRERDPIRSEVGAAAGRLRTERIALVRLAREMPPGAYREDVRRAARIVERSHLILRYVLEHYGLAMSESADDFLADLDSASSLTG